MRSRRRRLICRWAGVVILVVWGLSFVRAVVVAVNHHTTTDYGGGMVAFFDSVEFSRGLIVQQTGRTEYGGFSSGLSISNPTKHTSRLRVYLLGERVDGPMGFPFRTERIIPATVPLGLSAALIGFSYWRRYPKGHCPKCGYDLTGIADQCPECGHVKGEPVND